MTDSRGANPIQRVGDRVSTFAEEYFPDPFVFTLLLTFLTFGAVIAFTDSGPGGAVAHWGVGFWQMLEFAMQAGLVLLVGWAAGDSAAVKRALRRLASIPRTHTQALLFAVVFGYFFGLVHWAIALITNSIFARELAYVLEDRGIEVHYPLLVAAALVGIAPSQQGISGIAALLSAEQGHFLEAEMGVIPITETVLTLPNALVLLALFIASVVILPLLLPPEGERISRSEAMEGSLLTDGGRTDGGTATAFKILPSSNDGETRVKTLLLDSPLVGIGLGLMMVGYLYYLFSTNPFGEVFGINIFISIFLAIGLVLNGALRRYMNKIAAAWRGASQWVVQFQFYGGIMGLVVWSGLIDQVSGFLVNSTGEHTFYFAVTAVSGIINLLIPSGGGQWIVTGEILADATTQAGAEHNWMIIAFSMGDQLTNIIHPFVLIPVFAIAGISFKHLGGYLVIAFTMFASIVLTASLLFGVFL